MSDTERKVVYSGIQPSGILTLGNYMGAVNNWLPMQEEKDCLFCIVDMHAITVRQDPAKLRSNIKTLLSLYLAFGLDPEKSIIYVQSHVPEHAQLSWVLNTFTYMGELSRMTQYKEKAIKHADNLNAGLFDYPVLMASDILLYNTDEVPVGVDQTQHVELTRDIALRFNNIYGDVFKIPTAITGKVGAKIMALQSPERKMSKSDENPNEYISLLDKPDIIRAKFRRAVTDSEAEVRLDWENKPGISNLMSIYSIAAKKSYEEIEAEFRGVGYGDFKAAVGDAVVGLLSPVQERYNAIIGDKAYLENVMKTGADRAQSIARRTLRKVYKKVGFIERPM